MDSGWITYGGGFAFCAIMVFIAMKMRRNSSNKEKNQEDKK
jgi:hypothetical protein